MRHAGFERRPCLQAHMRAVRPVRRHFEPEINCADNLLLLPEHGLQDGGCGHIRCRPVERVALEHGNAADVERGKLDSVHEQRPDVQILLRAGRSAAARFFWLLRFLERQSRELMVQTLGYPPAPSGASLKH